MGSCIYVRGFPSYYTKSQLKAKFKTFGRIRSVHIVNETEPKPKLFAYIRFFHYECGPKAVKEVHGTVEGECIWLVNILQDSKDRQTKLDRYFERKNWSYKGKNVYIRDFPQEWTEENLHEIFDKYGEITSAKISGNKAYVCFDCEEEAKAAIQGEQKKIYGTQHLYVTLWNHKRNLTGRINRTKKRRQKGEKIVERERRYALYAPDAFDISYIETPHALDTAYALDTPVCEDYFEEDTSDLIVIDEEAKS